MITKQHMYLFESLDHDKTSRYSKYKDYLMDVFSIYYIWYILYQPTLMTTAS